MILDVNDLVEWYLRAHQGDSVKAGMAAALDFEQDPSNSLLHGALKILAQKAKQREQVAFPMPAAAKMEGKI